MKPDFSIVGNIDVSRSQIRYHRTFLVQEVIQRSRAIVTHSQIFWIGLLLGSLPCFGSTVFIWLNRDGIVAVADSLERDIKPDGTVRHKNICKIESVGRFYIASTGFPTAFFDERPKRYIYSAPEEARSLASTATDVKDLTSKFIKSIEPKMRTAMSLTFGFNPKRFITDINGRDGALAVCIFEMTKVGPSLAIVSFTATATATGVRVDHTPPRYCPGDCSGLLKGVTVRLGAQNANGTGPVPTTPQEAIPWVTRIVESEIAIDRSKAERDKIPREVGVSLSVMVITRTAAYWQKAENRQTCPGESP